MSASERIALLLILFAVGLIQLIPGGEPEPAAIAVVPFIIISLWLVLAVWNVPIEASADVTTPQSAHRRQVRARLIRGLVVGVGTGVLVALSFGGAIGLRFGLLTGLFFGILGGLGAGLIDFAAPFLLFTEVALFLRMRRVVRFRRLLEHAREREVLRQAGAVYQFRHADLQDRLAARHRREHLGQA